MKVREPLLNWLAILLLVAVVGWVLVMVYGYKQAVQFDRNATRQVIEGKDCTILVREHTVRVECLL